MKYTAILFIFLASISLYSQNYYWYNGKKINLYVDSTKLNITTNKEFNFSKLGQEFVADLKIKQLEVSNNNTSLFSIDLPIKSYSSVVASLKSNKEIVSISPYFRKSDSSSIGTSSFFYIQLNKEEDYEFLSKFASQNNLKIVKQVPYMPQWYTLTTTDAKLNSVEASNIAYESGLFAGVDPGFMFNFKPNCTNDPNFSQLWGLKNLLGSIDINACNVWNITKGSGINVAVIDEGIDPNHNDLKANFHPLSFDAQSGTVPSVFDPHSRYHGTHVAGIIAAVGNNNLQVVGVAHEAKIMRISQDLDLSPNRVGYSEQMASGISWAWRNGADVINNSWGDNGGYKYYQIYSQILENSIDSALLHGRNGKGCVVVFSSGNWGTIDYPAYYHSDILCVGAIDNFGRRSDFGAPLSSAYGPELDIVGPGSEILSTIHNNSIGVDYGTSMAAPHISGVAALILSARPDLTQAQVRQAMESTCKKLWRYSYTNNSSHPYDTWNEEVGHGLVDAYAAVLYAMNYPCNSKTLTGTQTTKLVECKEIIMQNATVPNGVKLELKATERIILSNGVTVKSGGTLILNGAVVVNPDFLGYIVEEGAAFVIK